LEIIFWVSASEASRGEPKKSKPNEDEKERLIFTKGCGEKLFIKRGGEGVNHLKNF
jgi:hypothetical protein